MRKYLVLVLSLSFLVSCEEDLTIFDVDNGEAVTELSSNSGTLPVPAEGAVFEIEVGVTTRSDSDRTIDLSFDAAASTALPAEFTVDPSSLVIPAGEFVGVVLVSGNFDEIPDLTTTTAVFNLNGVEGARVSGDTTFSLDLFKKCDSDLAGTYLVSSTGTSTDGGTGFPTVNDFLYTVQVEQGSTDLDYTISDGVAGVYIEWYTVYGYTFETEGNFTDVCDSLSGSWTDAFGSTVVLTGTVNPDGTLTISWTNGFGDAVTATYTKQ